jgi:hypothetical protein
MAEATDRPEGTAVTPAREPSAPAGEPGAVAPPEPETYRPLSLLALAGFVVAVLYALAVVVGGVVALLIRIPWLMPGWTFLIPVAALIVCWLARARIRNAEGTLGGQAFTVWGLRLSVVVGLLYAAYFSLAFFAIWLQAKDCANEFFEQIKQGQTERAFLLGMGEDVKTVKAKSDEQVRDEVQGRFNTPAPGGPGAFTFFRRNQMVRGLEPAGGEVRTVPTGVKELEYRQGGYRVVLTYHVVTPLAEFEAVIETFGRDSRPGEPKGRQWQVVMQRGETYVLPASVKPTPRGEGISQSLSLARAFANSWQEKVNQGLWGEVYLDTLKPSERAPLRKGLLASRLAGTAPVAGLAPLGAADKAVRDLLDTHQARLAQSKLIRLDEKTFWASPKHRDAILEAVRQPFPPAGGGGAPFILHLVQAQAPLVHIEGGQITLRLDAELTYTARGEGGPSSYIVEGYMVVSADEAEADNSPRVWRVEGIELLSGRTPPEMQRMRPPPQGGQGAGPGGPPPG